jgi:hypothetical protein
LSVRDPKGNITSGRHDPPEVRPPHGFIVGSAGTRRRIEIGLRVAEIGPENLVKAASGSSSGGLAA